MKLLLSLALLLWTWTAGAEERTLAVGMPETEARALLKDLGKDISANMDMVIIKEGLVWEFEKYKTVLTVLYAEGKVSHIIHNTLKDFFNSKSVRAAKEKEIQSANFDTARKTCTIK